jgi:hypothetical protein
MPYLDERPAPGLNEVNQGMTSRVFAPAVRVRTASSAAASTLA